ncbi:MAG: Ig-like domain-containing protein [bacterium]
MKQWVNHLLLVGLCGLVSLAACKDSGGGDQNTITVAITSPTNQSYITGQLQVTVDVTGEVDRVELLVDDQVVGESAVAPYTIPWDTSTTAESLHRLRVVAYGPGTSQSTSQETMVVIDRTAPTVDFSSLTLPYVLSGETTIEVSAADQGEVAEVRLLIDGELHDACTATPCSFVWDTTTLADGPAELTAEVTDAAGNVTTLVRPVAVVNDGTIITFIDGSGTGLYDIPEGWENLDLHEKYHFDMPAGTTEVMAIGQWFNADWQMIVDTGTGFCPHSGTSLANVTNTGGQVIVRHAAADLGLTEYVQEQWFAHIGHGAAMDLSTMVGEGTYFALTAVLY